VAADWLEMHIKGRRTERESSRIVSRYIEPHIGERVFADLRRDDITEIIDRVQENSGRHMADGVLKTLRSIANWHATRVHDYVPPFVAGMSRVQKGEGRRKRILGDDEIRAVWSVKGQYGDFVRLLLLTAQRREKLITLRWEDISPEGVWTIPSAQFEKGNPGALRLPPIPLEIIEAQPRFEGNAYVFAGRNNRPTAKFGGGQYKAAFDKDSGVTGWRLHDLRRTARSLMSRAGVRPDIAERVLGHARPDIEAVYDRYGYQDEMADALTKLAELIKQITSSA
jgi:integrase